MMNQSFGKAEKLKSRKLIDLLFSEGSSVKAYPIIAVYLALDGDVQTQVGFSVSKRRFKKAVDRNLIKRRMREAYRINREVFSQNGVKPMAVMFIYVGKTIPEYTQVEERMIKALNSIVDSTISKTK